MAFYRTQPSTCCPECFADPWLRDYIKEISTEIGTCNYCRGQRQSLVPVDELTHLFENLLSYYEYDEGHPLDTGDLLIWMIQDDWEVFTDDMFNSKRAADLLDEIMESQWDDDSGLPPVRANDVYIRKVRKWSHDTLDESWEEFSRQVKEDPNCELIFGGDADFHDFLIREQILGNRTLDLPAGTILYRARLGYIRGTDNDHHPFSGSAIGAPPPDKADPGRANEKGRVVLYCADQKETAVAEVRPARGEYVSVAELSVQNELRIVDLSGDHDWPNPFTTEYLAYEVEFARLLYAFAEELAKPLRRREDVNDYLPSQRLAQLFEQAGVDGIRYPSAMAPEGTNIVLFNPQLVEIGDSELVEISDVHVEYREYHQFW